MLDPSLIIFFTILGRPPQEIVIDQCVHSLVVIL